jgi:hypothetical protein
VQSAVWYSSMSWSLKRWNGEQRAWLISPMKHSSMAQLENVDLDGSECADWVCWRLAHSLAFLARNRLSGAATGIVNG